MDERFPSLKAGGAAMKSCPRCRGKAAARSFKIIVLMLAAILPYASQAARGAGYICAEGGGGLDKGRWAKPVFEWMIRHGGARRVAVIGYHAEPDLSVERIFLESGAADVRHLTIDNRKKADAAETHAALMASDIIWMRGGDQSKYVRFWRNTATEMAIRAVYERGGVIGGTSAGAAVLGEVIFDAFVGSLQPADALRDAYTPMLTLTTGFLELTPGVLFDTHFTERGRIGRLPIMLARRYEDAQQDLLGVGLDYRTALCVSPDLTAEILGEGTVTFVHLTPQSLRSIGRGRQPMVTALAYSQLTAGYRYDLAQRRIISRPVGRTAKRCDALSDRRFEVCTIRGDEPSGESKGAWRVIDGGQRDALFRGTVELAPAERWLSATVVVNNPWTSERSVENSIGGAQWALSVYPGAMAVIQPAECTVHAGPPAVLGFQYSTMPAPSTLILDRYQAHAGPPGPFESSRRQAAVIEDARLHILGDGAFYHAGLHAPLLTRRRHDLNADGQIDHHDLERFTAIVLGAPAAVWELDAADATGDGRVDERDTERFAAQLIQAIE